MELGVPKVGQNRNQVVSGKGDLTGKMAMFGGFVRNVPQKIRNFFFRRLQNSFAKSVWYKSCRFSTRIFFKNIQGVTLWLSNRYFCGQKWRANFYFRNLCLQISSVIFRELAHTLLIKPIRPREEVFPKMGSSLFSVTSYTIVFWPYKRTEI